MNFVVSGYGPARRRATLEQKVIDFGPDTVMSVEVVCRVLKPWLPTGSDPIAETDPTS